MFCKYCGKEVEQDVKFCPNCGAKLEEAEPAVEPTEVVSEAETTAENKPLKVWFVFGKVSKILSTVAISLCWIPYLSFVLAIPAIVLGALSKKSQDPEIIGNFKGTLIKSIIAAAVSMTVYIIIVAVMEISAFSNTNFYF